MNAPAYLQQPTIQRIPTIIAEVGAHQLLVPKFQRPFVWTDEDRIALMRSIYDGLPIGSLMVWRTKDHAKIATYRLPGTKRYTPNKGDVHQYLLDGHQRVTTLVTGLTTPDDDLDLDEEVADGYRALRPIYYDLECDEDAGAEGFVFGRKGSAPPPTYLPLPILFDSYQLHVFQAELVKSGVGREVVNRTDRIVTKFKDYSVPVVPIVTDDLEVAARSFQMVNTAGQKMSEVHMAAALAFSKTDLRGRVSEISEVLQVEGWGELDEQRILDTSKMVAGLDIRARTLPAFLTELDEDLDLLERTQRALVAAVRFLRRRCDIFGPKTLPYSYQIVLLAAVLDEQRDGEELALDHDVHDEILWRWLWTTTYTEYFAGMSDTGLRRAREHLSRIVKEGVFSRPLDLNIEVGKLGRFDFRSARSRAIAVDLATAAPVNSKGQKAPRLPLIAEMGSLAFGSLFDREELAGDRTLLESVENRFVARPPDQRRLRAKLRRAEMTSSQLESHFIDRSVTDCLKDRDFRGALEARRRMIIKEERDFVVDTLGLNYMEEV